MRAAFDSFSNARSLLFAFFCLFLTAASCQETSETTVKKSAPRAKNVLAYVGQQVISVDAFKRRYSPASGLTPSAFLKKLIEEKLLYLEAKEKGLQKSVKVQQEKQKAMAQLALKVGFHRWFSPESISSLEARKVYHEDFIKYFTPKRLKTVHALAMFPKKAFSAKAKLSEKEKVLLPIWKKESKAIAQKVLQVILKKDPKSGEEFKKIVEPLSKQYNKPIPAFFEVRRELLAHIDEGRAQPNKVLRPILEKSMLKLQALPFCAHCSRFLPLLIRWAQRCKKTKPLLDSEVKRLKSELNIAIKAKTVKLSIEDLPPFAAVPTPGFFNVVAPFLNATKALKPRQYTRKIVATRYGYHVIFFQKVVPEKRTSFSQAQKEIKRMLFLKKRPKMFNRWVEALGKKFPTQIYEERLKGVNERM